MSPFPSRIILIGLPGSGKTTLGKALAAHLKVPFADLDALVEAREKATIREVFAAKGETHFRKEESNALRNWYKKNERGILATGGGAPCFEDNMNVIKKVGTSIFLDVPTDVIASRLIQMGLADRPLFAGVAPDAIASKLAEMREHRLPWYRQASITVTGSDLTITDILERLEG